MLFGTCAWTYSPTQGGAMMSSRHCRTSVRASRRGRSARLSEKKVTRANWRAISGSVAQKLLVERLAEFRPIGVAHDRRRHRRGPAEVVVGQELEEFLDLIVGKAADVVALVDVARRRSDHDEIGEHAGRLQAGERTDHRAHGMSDEHRILQLKRAPDLHHIIGITLEPSVFRRPGTRRGRIGRRRHDRKG